MTTRKASASKAPAKEVGQLRYALVDAFAPLTVGVGVATLEGLPNMAAWMASASAPSWPAGG